MQEKELTQEIEELTEIQDTKEEPKSHNQYVDLMPSKKQVTI